MVKQKCEFNNCIKKIGITAIKCRCNMKFCNIHIPSNIHKCSFNYKEHYKELDKKNQEKEQKIVFHNYSKNGSEAY
jgi:hypothetical protein